MSTLFPGTAILMTAMQSGMDYVDAASEFADNASSEAAGNASEMFIVKVHGKAVMFIDHGNGVKNINDMFTLGGSGSRGHATDIGRFGVGSKFGAMTFGHKVTVHTVRNGKYHVFSVDWDDVLQSEVWPEGYSGSGKDASEAPASIRHGGTAIVIENLKPYFAGKEFTETFKKQLGMRFIQQFANERDILVCKAKTIKAALDGKFSSVESLSASTVQMLKEATVAQRTEKMLIDGKLKATVSFAKLPTGDSALSGIHIAFGGRTIETVTNALPGGRKVPSKLFAVIMLDKGDWKKALNYNKTRITLMRDELLSAFEDVARDLLDELESSALDSKAVKLSLSLSNVFNEMFGDMLKTNDPGSLEPVYGDLDNFKGDNSEEDGEIPGTVERDDPDSERELRPVAGLQADAKPGTSHIRGGAFKFDFSAKALGTEAQFYGGGASVVGRSVQVKIILNLDNPMLSKAMMEARNSETFIKSSAVMAIAMAALADIMMTSDDFKVALARELGNTYTFGKVMSFLTRAVGKQDKQEAEIE